MSMLLDTLHRIYAELAPKLHSVASIADIEDILLTALDVSFFVYNTEAELIYSSKNSGLTSDFSSLLSSSQNTFLQNIRSWFSFRLNVPLSEILTADTQIASTPYHGQHCSFFPIHVKSGHICCLAVWKPNDVLQEEDAILCSAAAMIIGMLISRAHDKQFTRNQAMKASAQAAVSVLSYSEHSAIRELLKCMDGKECTIVISDFANRIYVTRSVISSALRKLESSDVFLVKSLGMRGTYIRINNPYIFDIIGCQKYEAERSASPSIW